MSQPLPAWHPDASLDDNGDDDLMMELQASESSLSGLPASTSEIVQDLLPLRRSLIDYERSQLSCAIGRSPGSLAELCYSPEERKVMVMRRFLPAAWYPHLVTDDSRPPGDDNAPIRVVCRVRSADTSPSSSRARRLGHGHEPVSSAMESLTPEGLINSMRAERNAWVSSQIEMVESPPPSLVVETLIDKYSSGPLHVFNYTAVAETNKMADGRWAGMWSQLYAGDQTLPPKETMHGALYNNTLVDMRPFERNARYEVLNDAERRRYMPAWKYFIDPEFTTMNTDAGRMRCLADSVAIRVMTPECLDKCSSIIEALCHPVPRPKPSQEWVTVGSKARRADPTWNCWFAGIEFEASNAQVKAAIARWAAMRGHNTPSLHVFRAERLVTLSPSSGCLMKCVSRSYHENGQVIPDNALWLDSLVVGSEQMRNDLGIASMVPRSSLSVFRSSILLFPYTLYNDMPRPSLATSMSTQAIAHPCTQVSSVAMPKHQVPPVVVTPLGKAVMDASRSPIVPEMPGINVIVAYINSKYTYEDSVIVSDALQNSGVAATIGEVVHPIPSDVANPMIGSTLSTSTHLWWRPCENGYAKKVGMNKANMRYVVAAVNGVGLCPGDKVATTHGQKQTVSKVVKAEWMPLCTDVRTGKSFRPHILVAASSVHNRATLGQILEARAGAAAVDVSTFDPLKTYPPYVTSVLGDDGMGLPPAMCTFTNMGSNQKTVMSVTDPSTPCKADYGVIRLNVLIHLVRDKQQFASSVPRAPVSESSRLRGSPVRIAEMDLLMMQCRGLQHCVSELIDSSDQCVVTVCNNCRRLTMLCDCQGLTTHAEQVVTRYSTVVFDIMRSVYTLGLSSSLGASGRRSRMLSLPAGTRASNGDAASSSRASSSTSRRRLEDVIPSSFKYRPTL